MRADLCVARRAASTLIGTVSDRSRWVLKGKSPALNNTVAVIVMAIPVDLPQSIGPVGMLVHGGYRGQADQAAKRSGAGWVA